MTNETVLSYTADPSLVNVLVLVTLGLLGTIFNLALFLAALADLKHCGVLGLCQPLSCTLVHVAATGLVESTVNASLSAFYTSGGFSSAKESSVIGKSVLLGTLLFTGISHAWGVAGALLSSLQGFLTRFPGNGVLRVRVAFIFVFLVSAALSIAIIFVLVRNKNAISSTSVIPRIKSLNISQALRYVITVIGFAAPWVTSLIAFVLTGKQSFDTSHSSMRTFLPSSREVPPLFSSSTILLAVHTSLYILLRLPFELASLISGARPTTLHSSLAWCRFIHCPMSPLASLISLGKLGSTMSVLLRCFPRTGAVSPTSHERFKRAGILMSEVQIRVNSVPLLTPVIFPTPGGLYLRVSRHHESSGFSYRACDVTADVPYSNAQLERRDVFLREPRKSVY